MTTLRAAGPIPICSSRTGLPGRRLPGIEQAKLICRDCLVRAPCLDWALDRGVAFGIWGGFTEDERRAIRGTLIRRQLSRQATDG